MSVIADLYAAQPFWIWLAVGVLLLTGWLGVISYWLLETFPALALIG